MSLYFNTGSHFFSYLTDYPLSATACRLGSIVPVCSLYTLEMEKGLTMQHKRGFTLIELVVTLALIGIVVTVAVPSFGRLIDGNRVTSVSNSVAGVLSYARSEAVRRGARVAVVPTGGSYAGGMSVQIPNAGGGSTTLRQIEAPGANVNLSMSSGAAMSFRGNGFSGQPGNIEYQICAGSGDDGVRITVTVGGQVRSASIVCP